MAVKFGPAGLQVAGFEPKTSWGFSVARDDGISGVIVLCCTPSLLKFLYYLPDELVPAQVNACRRSISLAGMSCWFSYGCAVLLCDAQVRSRYEVALMVCQLD